MSKAKKRTTDWITVEDGETVHDVYERLLNEGYQIVGRREQPIFFEKDGEPVWLKQNIQFKVKKVNG